MPALQVDDIVLVSAIGNYANQRTINTFPYKVTALEGIPEQSAAFDDLHAELNATTGVLGRLRACAPAQYTMTFAWYQVLAPIRYRKYVKAINTGGSFAGNGYTANVQASITRVGERAGRKYVGGVRVPIGTDLACCSMGFVTPALKTKLDDLATAMALNIITPVVIGTYRPLVGLAPIITNSEFTFATFAQDTTRTLRRRTVGLGE